MREWNEFPAPFFLVWDMVKTLMAEWPFQPIPTELRSGVKELEKVVPV